MKVVGHLNSAYGYKILPFLIVVHETLTDKEFLRFSKKSDRAVPYLPQWFLRPCKPTVISPTDNHYWCVLFQWMQFCKWAQSLGMIL